MITLKSNTDTVLELPTLPGTLSPGATMTIPWMTVDVLRAVDLGLVLVPSGAEAPDGLPPVIFDHQYPAVLPVSAARAQYARVLRMPGGFHDGTSLRDFVAYYADGSGMSCAFSDDGLAWAIVGSTLYVGEDRATRWRTFWTAPEPIQMIAVRQ